MTIVVTSAPTPGPYVGGSSVLWRLIGADMNVTTDQAFAKAFSFGNFVIDKIVAMNASASLTLAAGGIYTAASKGGVAIVAAAQLYSSLTAAAKAVSLALANTDKRSDSAIFLNLTVPQGVPATCDIYIIGTALS
ncbi:hypothetical protein D9M73_65820 [compost metagenome]|nr:MAG TPA: hypothetical protein [Caudoviricetes sp.]